MNPSAGVFDPGHLGELTRVVPAEMVDAALWDRSFATYDFFREVAATGADSLFRAKTDEKAMKLPVLAELADGSYLSPRANASGSSMPH
ncbi:hypothetical protein DQ353_17215 [Arthrobacter sp. AQ5-05]|uniref:hypothetical protein n=1 Tax=Arthrobacter sp. AQ5-05 TaxID=2184581 RepID=UPI000DCD8513|nr:hypothetical protein [Arthrobacter sp. AQ5-05]RAX48024.1 hypothetical protein DQ353_17215 [Arthrobacter sp. AQ5-05]